jgi:hypothetical protein
MRVMTITRLFAASVLLLGGTPAFAARAMHPDTHEVCGAQNAMFCGQPRFRVEIPGLASGPETAVGNSQAKANAASKTWPGDMVLD